MRIIFGLVLVAGIGLAGTAATMVRGQMQAQSRQIARVEAEFVPTVEVWAVTRPVVYGEAITSEDVHAIRYAEEFLPEGAFRTLEELFPEGEAVPRVVLRQMEEGEPVLAAKVTGPGEDAGLTSRLTPGMRAFAISVDVASGVSGFLRPGDRVDVYWTGPVEANGVSREVTRLIETNLGLVAIDQTADDNLSGAAIARTVTVEATPEAVGALALAQATGSLALALVGQGDEGTAGAVEVDQRSLLGLAEEVPVAEAAPPPEPPAPPRTCTVRTRRAGEAIETPIPCRG